jgi:hypothetical protein
VVNVGPRQGGRERPGNVVDCDYGVAAITAAIGKATISNRRWRNPYGKGDAGIRIAQTLAEVDLASVSLHKCNSY